MRAILFVCLAIVLVLPSASLAQSEQQSSSTGPVVAEASAPSGTATDAQAAVPALPAAHSPADVNRQLRIPIIVWAAAVAADQTTTYLFSSRYPDLLHETNVLVRGLEGHPAAMVAAGTAIDAATGWAAYRLLRGHPRLAKAVFYGAAAYRSYLTAFNIRMMRRAQAIRSAASGSAVR